MSASERKARMPRPTPLPGRQVRGSTSGRPITALLDLLGRRWALRVIWELRASPGPTFRELQAHCDGVSSSVLAERLRELGEAGIVTHASGGYTLTDQGKALLSLLLPLDAWASTWRPRA
ncbi:MAG TPA: helix-turn-helix domain-containing protein [Jiangellaceae bacterium]